MKFIFEYLKISRKIRYVTFIGTLSRDSLELRIKVYTKISNEFFSDIQFFLEDFCR
jgi:hypothetical protein